ncbi:unnamed protein product [Allacma fusca]|uniref:Noggin n=1 Tax=Allacma fusca TaxID=39272 RepID=A0A8J2P3E5_9HEXA|nr:unnamed protein product [Allacma fusca]
MTNGLSQRQGSSPYVVRPSPAKDLAVTKLQEPVGTKYDPSPNDLDTKLLRIKLGKNYDTEYMSIRKPYDYNSNGTVRFPFKRNRKGRLVPIGDIPKSIKKLQYGAIAMPDGSKLRTRLSPKLRRKLVQFLWAYTSCPVYEKWRDLGIRFWPRWLKEGHCQSERSCSIPPGMTCKPSEAEYKVILRWHCQDWEKAKKCRWIPIRHPVITACACDCQHYDESQD